MIQNIMKRVLFLAVPLLVLSACEAELEQPMPLDPATEPAVEATVYHAATESGTLPDTRIYADENMKVL